LAALIRHQTLTSPGIGKATAFAFAKYGVQRLALSDRPSSSQALNATAKELQSQFPNLSVAPLLIDVTSSSDIDKGVSDAVAAFGRIDIAVHNAGISGQPAPTHEMEEADWEKVLDVNLRGVWRSQKRILRQMLTQENLGERAGRGTIVNVASMYGLVGPPGYVNATPYTTTKHAVVGLTRAVSSLPA
jgi:NAD(P)-dependent dehydrogenase (short-subunit alcohol dehydrogenase family)